VYPQFLPIYVRPPPTIAAIGVAKVLPSIFVPLLNFVNQPMAAAPGNITAAVLSAICIAIPLHLLFRPFVATIHIKLPNSARLSAGTLATYVKNLPRNEPLLMFTTMGVLATPSQKQECLRDLRHDQVKFYDFLRFSGDQSDILGRNRQILSSVKKSGLFRGRYEATPGGDGENKSLAPGIWTKIVNQIL
jgi:hypothetical protein